MLFSQRANLARNHTLILSIIPLGQSLRSRNPRRIQLRREEHLKSRLRSFPRTDKDVCNVRGVDRLVCADEDVACALDLFNTLCG
jgi:hypothetical protein